MIKRSFARLWRKTDMPAIIVMLLGVCAGYGLFTLGSAAIDRKPPVDYIAASAANPSAPVGGTIDIHFDVYRYRICPVIKVSRTLTDATGTEHAVSNYTFASNTRPGRESYDRTITIPEAVAIGRAFYQIRISYACNFIHNLGWPIIVASPRVYFRITTSS